MRYGKHAFDDQKTASITESKPKVFKLQIKSTGNTIIVSFFFWNIRRYFDHVLAKVSCN